MNEIKFNGLGVVLEWKYGCIANTKQIGDKQFITSWRHPTIPQPDEMQLEQDFVEYREHLAATVYKEKRKKEYPEVGDQLGAIIETLKFMKTEGIDIGSAGDNLVDQINAVKVKYPKP